MFLRNLCSIAALAALYGCPAASVPESYTPARRCGGDGPVRPPDDLARWPYLQSVAPDSAVIAWATLADEPGWVTYGATPEYGASVTATSSAIDVLQRPYRLHAAHLSGLEPDTAYCYRVHSPGALLATSLEFRTAATAPNATVRFIAVGDMGSGNWFQGKLRDHLVDEDVDFWITTGDNAYMSGTFDEFEQNFFRIYRDWLHEVPVFPTAGNHDYRTSGAKPYVANFFLPANAARAADRERYYSFDWGPLHMVALDTERPLRQISDEARDDMADWLAADLAATTKPWKVVFMHKPPYVGKPGRDANVEARRHLVPLFEKHGVQLVLTGHNHYYERFVPLRGGEPAPAEDGGVVYVTTGGGGADTYASADNALVAKSAHAYHYVRFEADGCGIAMAAIDSEGKVLDRYRLERCPDDRK